MKDPYLIPGTDVLRNKLGFTDHEKLDRAMHDIAESAALKLFASRRRVPPTMAGWQTVHRAMFGAIFDWAGCSAAPAIDHRHERAPVDVRCTRHDRRYEALDLPRKRCKMT
jgi:hypothetical protein